MNIVLEVVKAEGTNLDAANMEPLKWALPVVPEVFK